MRRITDFFKKMPFAQKAVYAGLVMFVASAVVCYFRGECLLCRVLNTIGWVFYSVAILKMVTFAASKKNVSDE